MYTFVNHQHLGGTYSHGLSKKRVSIKWEAVPQIWLLKEKAEFSSGLRKGIWLFLHFIYRVI